MMTAKEKEDEIEFEIVEDNTEGAPEGAADDTAKDAAKTPAVEADEPDDEDDEDDQKPNADASEEIDEATREKRERRRVEKKEQRERKRQYIADLEAQVQRLTEATSHISAKQATFERSSAETRIRGLERRYGAVSDAIAEAVSAGNGQEAARLMSERDAIRARHSEELTAYKAQNKPQRQAPAPDPRIRTRAQDWASANSWYKVDGADADSAKVNEIDRDIAASGVSPASSIYWQLLDERVKKALPHKFKTAEKPAGKSAPPVSSGKSSGGKRLTVRMTAAREDTLRKMGVWGDKEAMKPYLLEYAKYDRDNKAR